MSDWRVYFAGLCGLAAAALILNMIRVFAKQFRKPTVIEVESTPDARTPSGVIEFPATCTAEQVAELRRRWTEAINHPAEMVLLSHQYGVRYVWESGHTDDLQYPDREEAEQAVADPDRPEAAALIVRTVKERMPEYGEWYPAADLATYVLTPDGLVPVDDQPTEGEPS